MMLRTMQRMKKVIDYLVALEITFPKWSRKSFFFDRSMQLGRNATSNVLFTVESLLVNSVKEIFTFLVLHSTIVLNVVQNNFLYLEVYYGHFFITI